MSRHGAAGPAKVKLVVAYDGTDFSGFAVQRGQPAIRTVGGVLGEAIEKVLRHEVELACAGRTDAGVHAWGQVVSFPPSPGSTRGRLQSAVNSMLGPEVVVRSCELVDAAVRRPARSRRGGGTGTRSSTGPCPIRSATASCGGSPSRSTCAALRLAADPFIGEHDFAAFCRKGPEGSSRTRRVYESRWVDDGDGVLRYEIRANAFCWQMVRAIVGTLVEVGQGKRRPGDLMAILRAGDRDAAGQPAPPSGLCLWDVGYE